MIFGGGLITEALCSNGKKPAIKSIDISKNGTYTVADDVDGYSPILVNVKPVIRSIKITQNGTYTAPDGVDGYNPVIVNSPYETLYKQEHGITETVATDMTDDEGNDITVDGIPVDDIHTIIDTDMKQGNGDITYAIYDGNQAMSVHAEIVKENVGVPYKEKHTLRLTVTNLITGQSKTVERVYEPGASGDLNMRSADVTIGSGGYPILFGTSYWPTGWPYGVSVSTPGIYPDEIGMKTPYPGYYSGSHYVLI